MPPASDDGLVLLGAADGLMMPQLAPGARMRNGPEVVTAPLETK